MTIEWVGHKHSSRINIVQSIKSDLPLQIMFSCQFGNSSNKHNTMANNIYNEHRVVDEYVANTISIIYKTTYNSKY